MSDFMEQRRRMVQRFRKAGYIKTDSMADVMLRVPREEFMDSAYIDYAYSDQPYPIPGDGRQTISAPYMYPVFYEPLELESGERFLEVGAGSGYGAALARELVGSTGLVVAVEINRLTYKFAEANLRRTGYNDVLLVLGDGSLGYQKHAPYDAISITASCPDIPRPLIAQLKVSGKLMAPVGSASSFLGQDLIILDKDEDGRIRRRNLMKVAYVPLTGKFGWT